MAKYLHNTSIAKLYVSKDGTFAAWGRNKREALYFASKKLGRVVEWHEMRRELQTMHFFLKNLITEELQIELKCLMCN